MKKAVMLITGILLMLQFPLLYAEDQSDNMQGSMSMGGSGMMMDRMHKQMQEMSKLMDRIHKTHDPKMRQEMMREHMQGMQQGMGMMGGMMQGGGMGMQKGDGMGMQKGGRMGMNDDDRDMRHNMMEQRMDMMQMMMGQMMDHMAELESMHGK